jgi:hypothetical protein
MEDTEAGKCVCGKGVTRDCPDPESEVPIYIDCDVCDEFYEITRDLKVVVKKLKFKLGDKFLYQTIDHVIMFMDVNRLGLSFYKYEVQQYEDKMYGITIREIKK